MYYIYELVCPKSNQVKYIGRTQNTKTRLSVHVGSGGGDKGKWISSLKKEGLAPKLNVISKTNNKNRAIFLERSFIERHKNKTFNINTVNLFPTEIRIPKPSKRLINKLEAFAGGVDSIAVAAHKALIKFFKIK